MKRFLIFLLCLLLMLTGCQRGEQTPSEPTSTVESVAHTETTLPPDQPGIPLLDQGRTSGENGNLLYIPNPHVESMTWPEIRLYGNGLLLYEHKTDGLLHLKRISLEDGSLQAETAVAVLPSARVQVGNGSIGICDSGSGQVLILNESLELERTYSVPQIGENWYLNQELETLYVFYPEKGLQARHLADSQTRWILDNAAFIQPLGTGSGYVLFSYTDRADQKTYNRCLNLSTGTLETVPVDGLLCSGSRSGDQWLLRQSLESDAYILVNQDTAGTFTWPEGLVQLLSGRRQLLLMDGTYRNLYLHDTDGNFLSHCALSQIENASVGTDLVWSGYWQGYFFRDTYDNAAHLMFWNPEMPQEGENLSLESLETVQSPKPVMEQALYERAERLSERYSLDIRIGEQCLLEYSHYAGDLLADPYFVREALNDLEQALSVYPENFFRQLPYGNLNRIRIELVANLRGQEAMDTHPAAVGGFAQSMYDHYLIVLDGFSIRPETIYHELSHIIDKRLGWDAMLREDALFSEETWLSLQPVGFSYAESYTELSDALLAYEDSGYFVNNYAMTYPTEDRATLMAQIMCDRGVATGNPAMAKKMRYYADCIRDCFDTEGWPARTLWEQGLH